MPVERIYTNPQFDLIFSAGFEQLRHISEAEAAFGTAHER